MEAECTYFSFTHCWLLFTNNQYACGRHCTTVFISTSSKHQNTLLCECVCVCVCLCVYQPRPRNPRNYSVICTNTTTQRNAGADAIRTQHKHTTQRHNTKTQGVIGVIRGHGKGSHVDDSYTWLMLLMPYPVDGLSKDPTMTPPFPIKFHKIIGNPTMIRPWSK